MNTLLALYTVLEMLGGGGVSRSAGGEGVSRGVGGYPPMHYTQGILIGPYISPINKN